MIISDLNHLETISESSDIKGGSVLLDSILGKIKDIQSLATATSPDGKIESFALQGTLAGGGTIVIAGLSTIY